MAELTRRDTEASTFNLWRDTVMLSPLDRHLLPLLDGTRDRDALVEALTALAREDHIRFQHDGEIATDEAQIRVAAAEQVDAVPPAPGVDEAVAGREQRRRQAMIRQRQALS